MTKREFMESVIRYACDGEDIINNVSANDLIAFAQKEIEALDQRNAARSAKPTAKQKENEAIKEQILETFKEQRRVIASVIGEKMGISTNKASALCRQLVNEGKMIVEDVKVPKKGTQKAYTVFLNTEEEGE